MTKNNIQTSCFLCGKQDFTLLQPVEKKPESETDYGISPDLYYREICQCNNCMVFFNRRADLLPDDFYAGQYNAAIQAGSIARRFDKITKLPFPNSDNKNRVLRIVNYLYRNDRAPGQMKILDVGSGTCVFLYEMKKFGFTTHCVDPDPLAVRHARDKAGVDSAFATPFDQFTTDKLYDLISFNKVLEHVAQPVAALEKAKTLLKQDGLIYLELPDGEPTKKGEEMINRSEFFIDHHTIFNRHSFLFLAQSAGFTVDGLTQLTDPSGKHTICGFLMKDH